MPYSGSVAGAALQPEKLCSLTGMVVPLQKR